VANLGRFADADAGEEYRIFDVGAFLDEAVRADDRVYYFGTGLDRRGWIDE